VKNLDRNDLKQKMNGKPNHISNNISPIDKESPVPIYYQLKQYIMSKIKSGEWPQDSLIPSERELSEAFDVSRMTIRQAVNELVSEGFLYRQRGRGTYVSEPKIEQYDVMSFTEAALSHGYKASTDVRDFEVISPTPAILEKLKLSDKDKVYYVQRFRMVNTTIIAVEDVFLPLKYTGDLGREDFTGSIYMLLKDKYDYMIDHVDANIEAIIPREKEIKLFESKKKVPMLKVTAVHITNKNIKLYYEESIYRSDKFVFNINIYKR
jgi:GntR family transcriptional regulator